MKRSLLLCVLSLVIVCGSSSSAQVTNLYRHVGSNQVLNWNTTSGAAGDVNGDGSDDYFIASKLFPNMNLIGVVQIRSGADQTIIHQFLGNVDGDMFGASVVGLGDVNGDGFGDVVVGIPLSNNAGGVAAGRLKVYSGIDGSLLYGVNGQATQHMLGSSLTSLGDVDGDGVTDFASGSPEFDAGGVRAGQLDVFSGIDGSLIRSHVGAADDRLGTSVGNAGDVDGDGTNDLIAGARETAPGTAGISGVGHADIYSGSTGLLIHSIPGNVLGRDFGFEVDGLGDINGDGFSDVVVGQTYGWTTGFAGAVSVFSGIDGSLIRVHFGAGAPIGATPGHVSSVGDVNGDSVGDYGITFSNVVSHFVSLHSGVDGSLLARLDGRDTEGAAFSVVKVRRAGDVNSDGFDDVVFSDQRIFIGGNSSARVFVYAGNMEPVLSYASQSGMAADLSLSWIPAGPSANDENGKLYCTGATSGGFGLILGSLASADLPVLGLDLLVAVDPVNLLLTATLGATAAGEFVVDEISRRNPVIAGSRIFVQFFETSPVVRASNGLRFIAIP